MSGKDALKFAILIVIAVGILDYFIIDHPDKLVEYGENGGSKLVANVQETFGFELSDIHLPGPFVEN